MTNTVIQPRQAQYPFPRISSCVADATAREQERPQSNFESRSQSRLHPSLKKRDLRLDVRDCVRSVASPRGGKVLL